MLFFKSRKQKEAERKEAEALAAKQRIRQQAKEQSDQYLKIAHESADLVNTTVNPEVFFPRYQLVLEYLEKCKQLEWTGIYENSPESPSDSLARIEDLFPIATNEFIDRSFEATKTKADTLKTAKGKENAIRRYFEKMEPYTAHMEEQSVDHFYALKEKYITN